MQGLGNTDISILSFFQDKKPYLS